MRAPIRLVPVPLALALAGLAACGGDLPDPDAEVGARIQRVEAGLVPHHLVPGDELHSVEERLAFYRVPGVSLAVISDGRIEWARGWGETEAGSGVPVDPGTLFQAASISKPVMATGALRLVEQGTLALDDDVNLHLRSWQVPDNPFTAREKVTLRRLLSHSGGTTVHGFPGYAEGAEVPSIVQVLDGVPPANTAPVRVDTVPGDLWRYSGGGSSIVQLMMMDASESPFPALMRELVLEPVGMTASTYEQPLPADRLAEAAAAHGADGTPVPGRHHTYPEMAAAGLWTNPTELARLALELQRAWGGEEGLILRPETVREMLTVQAGDYGLGFGVEEVEGEIWFSHGGSNRGFRAYFTASADGGRGAVVMTNGANGSDLALEVMRAVAREYDWPRFQPVEREAVELGPDARGELVGSYRARWPEANDGFPVEITEEGGRLRAAFPHLGWEGRTLRAAAPDTLFMIEGPVNLHVERGADGEVEALVLRGLGQEMRVVPVR